MAILLSRHRAGGLGNLTLLLALTVSILISAALGLPTTKKDKWEYINIKSDEKPVASVLVLNGVKNVRGDVGAGKSFRTAYMEKGSALGFFESRVDATRFIQLAQAEDSKYGWSDIKDNFNVFFNYESGARIQMVPIPNKEDQKRNVFQMDYGKWQKWYKYAVYVEPDPAKFLEMSKGEKVMVDPKPHRWTGWMRKGS